MESRTLKTKKNAISSMIQNVINLLIALVGRIIFVRVLDESYLGINGLFSNVLGILSLVDLGMATVMMFHLYEPIANDDKYKLRQLIDFFKKIYTIIAIAIFCLGILLIPFLKYIINLPSNIPHIYIYYVVALLNVVISYLFVYRTTLVSADQKSYVLNNCVVFFKILIFVAQTIALFSTQNYLIYLLVAFLLNFACNIWQNRIAIKMYPFLVEEKYKQNGLDINYRKTVFRDIKATFLYKICGTIQSNTDSILTSIFCGTLFVGYYSNYLLIINQIVLVIGILFNSAKASVGNLMAITGKENKNSWELYQALELIDFWIVSFSSSCFFVLVNDFINIAFGRQYLLEISVVAAITLNFYTSNIRQVIWVFRETSGMFEPMKYITAVTAIINVVLSIVLGYVCGMFGIIIATVISRILYAWWKEPQILYKTFFNRKPSIYYITYIKRLVLCIGTTVGLYFLCGFITIENIYWNFIIKTAICVILSNIVLLLVYFRSKEFVYLLEHLLSARILALIHGKH